MKSNFTVLVAQHFCPTHTISEVLRLKVSDLKELEELTTHPDCPSEGFVLPGRVAGAPISSITFRARLNRAGTGWQKLKNTAIRPPVVEAELCDDVEKVNPVNPVNQEATLEDLRAFQYYQQSLQSWTISKRAIGYEVLAWMDKLSKGNSFGRRDIALERECLRWVIATLQPFFLGDTDYQFKHLSDYTTSIIRYLGIRIGNPESFVLPRLSDYTKTESATRMSSWLRSQGIKVSDCMNFRKGLDEDYSVSPLMGKGVAESLDKIQEAINDHASEGLETVSGPQLERFARTKNIKPSDYSAKEGEKVIKLPNLKMREPDLVKYWVEGLGRASLDIPAPSNTATETHKTVYTQVALFAAVQGLKIVNQVRDAGVELPDYQYIPSQNLPTVRECLGVRDEDRAALVHNLAQRAKASATMVGEGIPLYVENALEELAGDDIKWPKTIRESWLEIIKRDEVSISNNSHHKVSETIAPAIPSLALMGVEALPLSHADVEFLEL